MSKLRKLRKAKNMTQSELAKEIKVSEKTISRWEKDKTLMKANKAKELADLFGVSVGYLLGYIDDSEIYDDEVVIEPEKGTILTYSLERSNKTLQKKMFKDFITFFRDNSIFISDNEILSLYSMVQAANLNNATPRGRQFTDLIFSWNINPFFIGFIRVIAKRFCELF